jgi:hypothetical protein
MHQLLPHQQQALAYAKSRDRIALFMEMRLGKSVVVVRWARARELRRVLLIAPLTTLRGIHQWEGELTREGTKSVITLPKVPKPKWPQQFKTWLPSMDGNLYRYWRRGWFLINYEALLHRPEILHQPWDAIIIDESTRIRNPKAKLTKILIRHTDHVEHKALLSGLPNPEDPSDYFSQFHFLHGHFMGMDNFWKWRHRYFHQGYTQWSWFPNKGTKEKIRNYVHDHAFVLLRKTAGVGSKKYRMQIRVPMVPAQKAAIKEMRRTYALADKETKWATVVHTWMQRLAGGWHPITLELLSDAKMHALTKICRESLGPVVVWFRFNHEIERCQEYLNKYAPKLRVQYVHGQMKDSKVVRVRRQELFQDGGLDVLLIQVKLGRFGWNLSKANTEVYYSNTYEFEDRNQSEDRIIHLTKKDPCTVIDLVTVGTTDEDVVEALADKRVTARQFAVRVNKAVNRRILRYLKKAA